MKLLIIKIPESECLKENFKQLNNIIIMIHFFK